MLKTFRADTCLRLLARLLSTLSVIPIQLQISRDISQMKCILVPPEIEINGMKSRQISKAYSETTKPFVCDLVASMTQSSLLYFYVPFKLYIHVSQHCHPCQTS